MIKSIDSFIPYEGNDDYIFISYAHADDDIVLPVINELNRHGYNVWYDDGIEVGSEWQECIAEHLQKSSTVICFLSNSYVKSDNCRRELHYALSKKKELINVFLEDTVMTPGIELQISNIFALMKYSMTEKDFYTRLFSCQIMQNDSIKDGECESLPQTEVKVKNKNIRKNNLKLRKILRLSLTAITAGIVVAALIVGYFTGYIQRLIDKPVEIQHLSPETPAVFESEELYDVARDYSGKESPCVGDLYGLTDIDLSGKKITTLSGLQYFTDLYSLNISNCGITSLDTLPVCTVVDLNVSENPLASLDGIENAPCIEVLNASGCKLSDFGKLNLCQNLKVVNCLECRCRNYNCFRPLVNITDVTFSNTDLKSVSNVLDMSSLRNVKITDSNLTGKFFKSFDNEDELLSLELVNCRLDSLYGLSQFESLQYFTMDGCTGISDYSELENLDPRTVVTIK